MNIEGKLLKILPVETGVGKSGEWKRQCIIVEQKWNYNKPVCLVIWGNKININEFSINSTIVADINIESREHNGRWYSEIKVWRIKSSEINISGLEQHQNIVMNVIGPDEDLPF
jgi:hypothetical protein